MYIYFLLLFFLPAPSTAAANELPSIELSHLKTGDLVFQSLDCGPLCNAIESVTPAYEGYHFSHIGIVYKRNDSTFLLEAIGSQVQLTPLSKALSRSSKTVLTGRLEGKDTLLIPAAIQFSIRQLGVPYDEDFIYDNGKYYCSELVYDAFKFAQGGKDYFRLFPMTYKIPDSNETFPAWAEYFKEKKQTPPEGQPGCNPGSIACSGKLKMFLLQTDN